MINMEYGNVYEFTDNRIAEAVVWPRDLIITYAYETRGEMNYGKAACNCIT